MEKVIVITGGSQGLGKEIAHVMLSQGVVCVLSNHEDSLSEIPDETGINKYFCDITDPVMVEKVIGEINSKYGRIDILINNAGVWAGGELEDTSYDCIAKVMMVNALGTMNMTKAVIPFMKEKRSGKIVNIGSTNGIESKPERSVYSASKWAVTGFTASLRKDLAKYNIGVCGINPGLIRTTLHTNAGGTRDYTHAMEPADVAKVVEFVCSFDSVVFEQIVFRNISAEVF